MKNVKTKWVADNAEIINLIDVRTPAEFNVKNLSGSKNIPLEEIIRNHKDYLNKDEEYYIICHSGGRSLKASIELELLGYTVINVEGGISSL